MNTIKIYLKTSGSVAELHKDFAMYVGSFQNKLIDVYVPKEMLYSNKQNTFNNAVKIAGLLTATNGQQIATEPRYLDYLKEMTIDGVDYIVYERRLPKELTVYPGNQQLVINVVSVDNTTAEEPKILQIVTTQICNLLVQNSEYVGDEETLEPSQMEEINSKLAENQGDIINLQERTETAEINITKNTEKISQNTNEIANLKQVVGSGEDYIGTLEWNKLELPSNSELDNVVLEKRNRASKTSDVIIVVQKITETTNKNYKFIKALSDWTYYEIPPMELSGNGKAGIVSGTYAVGKDNDTLVDIAGGEILNIYVKDNSNQYRNIVEYLNTTKEMINDIINGKTKIGFAIKAIADGLGNNIANTYLTKALGITQDQMRDYAMPKSFGNINYISSVGFVSNIPTVPENGVQFIARSESIGETELFKISKEISDSFQLSNKNGYYNSIYIASDKNCKIKFKLITEYKKINENDWRYLNVELSNEISFIANNINRFNFSNPFTYLEESDVNLIKGDVIRQTLNIVNETSEEYSFYVYSNKTYPSYLSFTSQYYTLSDVENIIGQTVYINASGVVENGTIIFDIDNYEKYLKYKTNFRKFFVHLELLDYEELGNYPILIKFGDDIYNIYNFLFGNTQPITTNDLLSVQNVKNENKYSLDLELLFVQADDFAAFFIIPAMISAKQLETIIEDSDTIITDLNDDNSKINIHLKADIVSKLARVLVTPLVKPNATELVAITSQNIQQLLELGMGFEIENGHINVVLNDELAPFINYSKSQSLTDEQKAQARANIGAGSAVVNVESVNGKTGVVELSAENVGAVSSKQTEHNSVMVTDEEGNVKPSDKITLKEINLGSVVITPITTDAGETGIRFSIPETTNDGGGE